MNNCEEQIIALKKYLKKLLYIIENDAILTFMDKKIVNKKRIDDIICCIEASFPEIYKEQIFKKSNKMKSYICYQKLLKALNNKLTRGSSMYLVYYNDARQCISSFIALINSDIQEILNNN